MKYFCSILFLVTMTLNVMIPLVEQLRKGDMYEYSEWGKEDAGEKSKKEKETGKAKDSLSCFCPDGINLNAFYMELFRKSSFAKNDFPDSERYADLPERPPQA